MTAHIHDGKCNLVQKAHMLAFMLEHRDLATGKLTGYDERHNVQQLWKQLKSELDKLGEPRDLITWKKYWANMKIRARGKIQVLQNKMPTADMDEYLRHVSEDEEKILLIIGFEEKEPLLDVEVSCNGVGDVPNIADQDYYKSLNPDVESDSNDSSTLSLKEESKIEVPSPVASKTSAQSLSKSHLSDGSQSRPSVASSRVASSETLPISTTSQMSPSPMKRPVKQPDNQTSPVPNYRASPCARSTSAAASPPPPLPSAPPSASTANITTPKNCSPGRQTGSLFILNKLPSYDSHIRSEARMTDSCHIGRVVRSTGVELCGRRPVAKRKASDIDKLRATKKRKGALESVLSRSEVQAADGAAGAASAAGAGGAAGDKEQWSAVQNSLKTLIEQQMAAFKWHEALNKQQQKQQLQQMNELKKQSKRQDKLLECMREQQLQQHNHHLMTCEVYERILHQLQEQQEQQKTQQDKLMEMLQQQQDQQQELLKTIREQEVTISLLRKIKK